MKRRNGQAATRRTVSRFIRMEFTAEELVGILREQAKIEAENELFKKMLNKGFSSLDLKNVFGDEVTQR